MSEIDQNAGVSGVRDALGMYALISPADNSNVSPKNFTETNIGQFPVDWGICRLDSLGKGARPPIKAGPFGSALTKDSYVPNGYKIYGQEQVIRGDHRYGDYYISPLKYQRLRSCAIAPGDILLSLVGTTGKLLVIPNDAEPGIINPRLLRFSFDHDLINSVFFKYLFASQSVQQRLGQHAQGGTMDVLNAGILRSIEIQVPGIDEQRAIATTLSDADALIDALDRLIAKKRAIKQATQQQLLTGQTRLPGFTGEWESKQLGDVLHVRHGRSQAGVATENGPYPILASGGEIGRSEVPLYDRPSVLIGRKGTIDEPQFMDSPFWTVDTLFYTEINEQTVPRFVFYLFGMVPWRDYNEASGVPSLNAKTIEAIEVVIPRKDEQTAIATVLADMDAEIEALQRRRDKARQIKQGMMQQLLTGRVRLVTPEAADANNAQGQPA